MHLKYCVVIACFAPICFAQDVIHVSDYGARSQDGADDRAAIQSAVDAAVARQTQGGKPTIVEFDAGVYNLKEPISTEGESTLDALISISEATDLTLHGAIHEDGTPATVLQRNVSSLSNQLDMADVVRITGGQRVKLQNIVIDNSPQFASAGVCVRVDVDNDAVEVDVFENLPHFDGMQAFSANAWDLSTRDLKVGVPHLSISTNYHNFPEQWRHVSGGEGRRYRIENMGFAKILKLGDGVSWHFNVTDSGHQLRANNTDGLTLQNIEIPNGPVAVTSFRDVADLTCRRVVLAPTGNQLAVGPRDGMYTAGARGRYIYEDCHWEGVRWDPLALFSKTAYVDEMIDARTAKFFWYRPEKYSIDGMDATLWFDGGSADATIASVKWGETDTTRSGRKIQRGIVTFTEDVPQQFRAGSIFSAHRRTQTIIRNSTFQNNYGRAPYLSGVNLLIEGNTFRNNGYAFALGISSPGAGGFCRNVVIRNNTFSQTTWSSVVGTRSIPTSGAIRFYENNPEQFNNEPYHDNILIENNTFRGINFKPEFAAIDLRNAQNVTIRHNIYEDTPNAVQVHPASTDKDSITINDDNN